MKYLNKLFAFYDDDLQSYNKSSAELTSSLYSVTFVPKSSHDTYSYKEKLNLHNKVTIFAHGEPFECKSSRSHFFDRQLESKEEDSKSDESLGPSSYLLTATIDRTLACTSSVTLDNKQLIEDDWILVDKLPTTITSTDNHKKRQSRIANGELQLRQSKRQLQLQQMALDKSDVELIKASWTPVAKDPLASGVLLFKGLFTKFPQYLDFFPQFANLDVERIEENKRLLKHAVKVIETVTFVVDSIGDETKTTQLNEALINLVKGHLKRQIGLSEFRNLGIVLIDFICDINNRRGSCCAKLKSNADKQQNQLNKSSTSDSSIHSSDDLETMTSALDKIRSTSSPSSSSEEESYLVSSGTISNVNQSLKRLDEEDNSKQDDSSTESDFKNEAKIDTNLLVGGWTKLYSSILDLVKREESQTEE